MLADAEVLNPGSPEEAVKAFGDGAGITVVAGGTIVMPDIAARRVRPTRALLLTRAALDGISLDGGRVTIGAGTTLAALEDGDEPLATAARHVADLEIRAQATLGGNICSVSSAEAPRGDLQAPLIALGASVRSAGTGGERTESMEDFLANPAGRLVLDVSYDDAKRKTAYVAATRPHTHHYTILAVAACERDGEVRLAATGLAPHGVKLDPRNPLAGLEPPDDAVASGWYRAQVLPKLVERALADLS